MARYTIESTWVDARGVWHARVKDAEYAQRAAEPLSESEWRGLTRAARVAILAEIIQRSRSPRRTSTDIAAGTSIEHLSGSDRASGRPVDVGRPESVVFREKARAEHRFTPISAHSETRPKGGHAR